MVLNKMIFMENSSLRYTSRWSKGSAPRPASTPSFVVSLKVGVKEFVGEGSTAQAAKHAAAAKALQMLKVYIELIISSKMIPKKHTYPIVTKIMS